MINKECWINNGTKSEPNFSFVKNEKWTAECLELKYNEICDAVGDVGESTENFSSESWIDLIRLLPQCIREVLHCELKLGNRIISVGKTNWPSLGSVVVTVDRNFHAECHSFSKGVKWRVINDPHYCSEEVGQFYKNIEYLLIS